MPISFIKDGAQEPATPIAAKLINLSILQSFFPESEKLANITPIFKSGNHSKMENFRPISILVHTQFSYYIEQNGLLSSKQFGFRKGGSIRTFPIIYSKAYG